MNKLDKCGGGKASDFDERKALWLDFIKCLHFAAEAHIDQTRKDLEKTPYINHPIGVAYILSEEEGITNLNLLNGSLLHDTVEDTAVTMEDIRMNFGNYIGDLVAEVTDDKSLPKHERKILQIVHAKTTSPQGKVVKLADKLYNLRDLERSLPEGWTEQRRAEYFQWACQVCQGLRGVCPQLEAQLDTIFFSKGLVCKDPESGQLSNPDWPQQEELKPLLRAANFAAEKHKNNYLFNLKRCVPYINHAISVALIVLEEAEIKDSYMLIAALLLDVVGKTDTKVEEISLSFGDKVGQLVKELVCERADNVRDKLQFYNDRATSFSHDAKVIALAATIDIYQRLEQNHGRGVLLRMEENLYGLLYELKKIFCDTCANLEKKLDQIIALKNFEK